MATVRQACADRVRMNEVEHVCDLDSFPGKVGPLFGSEVVMQLL